MTLSDPLGRVEGAGRGSHRWTDLSPMYRHCIFCASTFPPNESIESFPIGRRLAFDAAKGRLWVVCRNCERWNLTPLEERWEAIEECERAFRGTRQRVSTENIGLARLPEGLELVRIGEPLRPEFAAWRYGDQFRRRRKRITTAAAAVVGGTFLAPLFGPAGGALILLGMIALDIGTRPPRPRKIHVPTEDGRTFELEPGHVFWARFLLRDEAPDGWLLELRHRDGTSMLSGPAAMQALGLIMPLINARGASQRLIEAAVREIEEVGSPERYFAAAELRARRKGWGYTGITMHPREIRLALEMAANEAAERAALEGELALLERAWREADEIAAIADELTLPDRVRTAMERLRPGARHGV